MLLYGHNFNYVYILNKLVYLSKDYRMKITTFLSLLFMTFLSFAQKDSLIFLNGKTMFLDITEFSATNVYYSSYLSRNGKLKAENGEIESYRVYSIFQNGEEKVLYTQDSTIGNFRTQNQMNSFVLGEKHAINYYNPKLFFYGGVGLGIASVLYNTYLSKNEVNAGEDYGFFHGDPGLLLGVTTFAYITIVGIPSVSLKTSTVKKTYLLQDVDFLDGYEKVGRSKKVFSALKGKLMGVGLGLVSYFILKP